MKKLSLLFITGIMLVFVSCSKDGSEAVSQQEFNEDSHLKIGQESMTFPVKLSGAQEVPPNDSKAVGQAIFHLKNDGTELHYTLTVANIKNITQCHIHLAPAGANGPVTVWLYPDSPPAQLIPGPFNGVLAKGIITASDLVGPLVGMPLSDLMDYIISSNAYVNLHTSQFPGGEIRGQF
ncbi:MAG: CHRD domain-containing protein [Bacteroidales bacterium]